MTQRRSAAVDSVWFAARPTRRFRFRKILPHETHGSINTVVVEKLSDKDYIWFYLQWPNEIPIGPFDRDVVLEKVLQMDVYKCARNEIMMKIVCQEMQAPCVINHVCTMKIGPSCE